ncbi:phosphoribosylglycinamide formyltransferase [Helicobacter enhydrae]|uniref:Phosphoribosylglycinamide formyltransferase n=1 Tax=Helicobacter enhydrae TaxID=222136 RepID=A0A1B1U5H0_9HELI|nr:phosphoribosylglycinamide formyltransferase [Helicobacter enhydrae]ANV98044.1 phosphoribosylglycinamide formyltransferase [Helicobacter enhydrae]
MLNIAILVSGNGSNLQSLIDYQNQGKLKNGKLSLVISNKADAYALTRASDSNLPSFALTNPATFETEALEKMREYKIDCIVLAGFLKILSPRFIQAFPNKIINIHPSLIPSFCGAGFYGIKVHQEALKYGVKVSGASVHLVNEVVDGGQIIAQRAVRISAKETPSSLQKKVATIEQKILPQALQTLINQILKENK